MTDVAIQVQGLGKRYRIGQQRPGYASLRERLGQLAPWRAFGGRAAAERPAAFWALKGVSFDVKRGEVVGIIGRNGAGKSTLLKLLSRITEPTEGGATVRGRVGSLLEVGTGFHPELSGRENVSLNGAILGMRRAEIARKFDEIVAFAEVERFIDTPVKHYSSGMYTRLAFAVAAHLEPEILVIDEVLAVGDAAFQQKCLGRMQAVSRQGRTVLFVSHNMQAVSTLCDRGVYLQGGQVEYVGGVEGAIRHYLSSARSACLTAWAGDEGDDSVRLLATSIQGEGGLRTDEPLRIRVRFAVLRPVLGLVCAVELYNQYQQRLVYSAIDDREPPPARGVTPGTYHWELTVPANTLAAGNYRIEFDLGVHNVRRITQDVGTLSFQLENVAGVGRRLLSHDNVIRPDWPWRPVDGGEGVV